MKKKNEKTKLIECKGGRGPRVVELIRLGSILADRQAGKQLANRLLSQ